MTADKKYGLQMLAFFVVCIGIIVWGLIAAFNEEQPPDLITIEHDGHKFIRKRFGHHGIILHHPDCPCGTSKEVERP